jgi:hypothetical protein
MSLFPPIARNHNASLAGSVLLDELADDSAVDVWLIPQRHHYRFLIRAHGPHATFHGGQHAIAIRHIDDRLYRPMAQNGAHVLGQMPEDHDHLPYSGGEQGIDHALENGPIPKGQQLLRSPHAPRLPGREHHR